MIGVGFCKLSAQYKATRRAKVKTLLSHACTPLKDKGSGDVSPWLAPQRECGLPVVAPETLSLAPRNHPTHALALLFPP